jgi:hypothetical protein
MHEEEKKLEENRNRGRGNAKEENVLRRQQ